MADVLSSSNEYLVHNACKNIFVGNLAKLRRSKSVSPVLLENWSCIKPKVGGLSHDKVLPILVKLLASGKFEEKSEEKSTNVESDPWGFDDNPNDDMADPRSHKKLKGSVSVMTSPLPPAPRERRFSSRRSSDGQLESHSLEVEVGKPPSDAGTNRRNSNAPQTPHTPRFEEPTTTGAILSDALFQTTFGFTPPKSGTTMDSAPEESPASELAPANHIAAPTVNKPEPAKFKIPDVIQITCSMPEFSSSLPKPTTHRIQARIQSILEETCFDWSQKHLPEEASNLGWECAEDVELNIWVQRFSKKPQLSELLADGNDESSERNRYLAALVQLRHSTVHRKYFDIPQLMELLQTGIAFTKALGEATEKLEKVQGWVQEAAKKMEEQKKEESQALTMTLDRIRQLVRLYEDDRRIAQERVKKDLAASAKKLDAAIYLQSIPDGIGGMEALSRSSSRMRGPRFERILSPPPTPAPAVPPKEPLLPSSSSINAVATKPDAPTRVASCSTEHLRRNMLTEASSIYGDESLFGAQDWIRGIFH